MSHRARPPARGYLRGEMQMNELRDTTTPVDQTAGIQR